MAFSDSTPYVYKRYTNTGSVKQTCYRQDGTVEKNYSTVKTVLQLQGYDTVSGLNLYELLILDNAGLYPGRAPGG